MTDLDQRISETFESCFTVSNSEWYSYQLTFFKAGYLAALPRWIPVSERLPEEGISVLAWGHMNEPGIAWRREGMWEDVEEIWLTGITHWMPLPQPPEVD